MKKTKTLVKELESRVRNQSLRKKFHSQTHVAQITGPSVVIEAIVQKASIDSGIDMDWAYFAGRGLVYAEGDPSKARFALFLAYPQSDI